MSFDLINLDVITREFMLREIKTDIESNQLFISMRLNVAGKQEYPGLLKKAAEQYDESWLAFQLRNNGSYFDSPEVQISEPDMLAEEEFNRFYLRGLCLRAIQEDIPTLKIYRAKDAGKPRPDSESKIGLDVSPKELLHGLRRNISIDAFLGLPSGPDSGLSAKLP